MPLFPELIAELNDALRKRRTFIAPSHIPPERKLLADPKTEPLYLDGYSVYLKQKVLAQIREFDSKRELYLSTILPAVQVDPVQEPTAPPATDTSTAWSFWRMFGY